MKDEAVKNADYERKRCRTPRPVPKHSARKKRRLQRTRANRLGEVDGVVDEEMVAEVVPQNDRRPADPPGLEKKEACAALLELEAELHKYVVSQDDANQGCRPPIRRACSGLERPVSCPIGTFLFPRPPASAKRPLPEGHRRIHVRLRRSPRVQIDMSEYMESTTSSRLIGPSGLRRLRGRRPPPERIRRRPYAVVLLDEIEKAHPRRLQHAPPDHGRRPPYRQRRPNHRLQEHHPHHDLQHAELIKSGGMQKFGIPIKKTIDENFDDMKKGLLREGEILPPRVHQPPR